MSNQFDEAPTRRTNNSGLLPLGRAVLLDPIDEKKEGSLIQLPPTVSERMKMMQDRGIVVDYGPECWSDEKARRASVGDEVFIPYLSGRTIEGSDGKTYRLVNDKDVFCRVVK